MRLNGNLVVSLRQKLLFIQKHWCRKATLEKLRVQGHVVLCEIVYWHNSISFTFCTFMVCHLKKNVWGCVCLCVLLTLFSVATPRGNKTTFYKSDNIQCTQMHVIDTNVSVDRETIFYEKEPQLTWITALLLYALRHAVDGNLHCR